MQQPGASAGAAKDQDLSSQRVFSIKGNASKRHPRLLLWYPINALIIGSLGLLLYGLAWHHSTTKYLLGFADAIVPLTGPSREKAEALLNWLAHTPGRIDNYAEGTWARRDPVAVLHDRELLDICGTSTNAFVNLARASGLGARRLLLVDEHTGGAKHVVAEVLIDGRWVMADPTSGFMFQDRSGQLLSKQDLRNSELFRQAISKMPGYSPNWSFEHTAYVHLDAVPIIGRAMGRILDRLFPKWGEAANWGVMLERADLWPILVSMFLVPLSLLARFALDRYGQTRRSIDRWRFRDRLLGAARVLFAR